MTAIRVAVVGGINLDVFALVDEQVGPGRSLPAAAFHDGPGGKGANQAVAAARLGGHVELVGRVGDDSAGRRLLDHLQGEGVDVAHVVPDPQVQTGRVVGIVQRGAAELTAAWPGANARLDAAQVHEARTVIERADVLLCQLEVPLAAVQAAIEHARRGHALVVLDPSPARAAVRGLVGLADLVRVNAEEARQLTDVEPRDEGTALRAARRLLNGSTRMACVSAGAAGDLLAWTDGHAWVPAPDVEVVDPTGAGDVLHAALAVRLAAGDPPAQALCFASAAAALAMTRLGAQAALPTPEAVIQQLRQGSR